MDEHPVAFRSTPSILHDDTRACYWTALDSIAQFTGNLSRPGQRPACADNRHRGRGHVANARITSHALATARSSPIHKSMVSLTLTLSAATGLGRSVPAPARIVSHLFGASTMRPPTFVDGITGWSRRGKLTSILRKFVSRRTHWLRPKRLATSQRTKV